MKQTIALLLIIVAAAVVPWAITAAQEKPVTVFGDGLSVDIRLERISKNEMEKLASLGFRGVRIGINWPEVEKYPEDYVWDSSQRREPMADGLEDEPTFSYDAMIGRLRDLGLHVSALLYFGNTLYTGELVRVGNYTLPPAPRTPEAIDAFASFAAATAQHYSNLYGTEPFTWLIWNEPDTDGGFPPRTDGNVVGQLIAATCQKIKKNNPDAQVTAPSLGVKDGGAFRYGFIRDLFKTANPLACLDAFTVHPYRPEPPETASADYAKLAKFLEPWQTARHVPVSVDEWGYPLPGYTLEEQAAFYLRMYLVNLAAGLPQTILYEWRDSGPDSTNNEHTYGMNTYDGKEKPVMRMWRSVMSRLSGRPYVGTVRPSSCDSHVHIAHFGPRFNKERDVIVAWTEETAAPHRLVGRFNGAVDLFDRSVESAGNAALSGTPLLIDVEGGAIAELACRS